ncbi:MAG: molybdopterin molybdotransferase MoeA [Thermoanaerobaculia bacterium]
MLDPEEAWQALLPHVAALDSEHLNRRAAAGRVLAASVAATGDLPSCDISALDGFALAGEAGVDGRFAIIGTRFAGDPERQPALAIGCALRIMTGAALPHGADRVVGVEETSVEGGAVRIRTAVPAGAAIRRRGEIFRLSEEILPRGAVLTPAALALLASQGIEEVETHRAPRIALLLTGNEVVPATATPAAGEVRDSHSDFLLAELRRLGLAPEVLGIARDEPDALARQLRKGLEAADVMISCGGVSMGEADFLAPVLRELGFETLFHGVAIQPGKPLLVARRGRKIVFGLPGNPASVMVAYWLFVRPGLQRMLGGEASFWGGALSGILGGALSAGRGRDRFVPAVLRYVDGGAVLVPLSPRGSHDLLTFGNASALLRVRAGASAQLPGDRCDWIALRD